MLLTTITLALSMQTKWKLAWSDEFDKPGLPDPSKWGYEVGYIRNNEAQYYTKARKENCRVEGGKLIIEGLKDNFENHPISSASINTRDQKTFLYGRFEVKAKLPKGKGTWPAIWFLGTNIDKVGWPKCGEVDLMEHVGYEPNKIHFNIHCEAYNHMRGTGKGVSLDFPDPEAWHVYGLEWHPDRMDFFLDDKKVFTFKKESEDPAVWPYAKPMYMLINLAVGGSWGGSQGIDDTKFPMHYEIDYVRYFEPVK